MVGDGSLRSKLEKLAAELGIAERVHFHGSQNSAETARLMSRAHLFVLASVSVDGDQEGQGLALQEAQAAGLPVVATDHGGFPEGIRVGKSGFLVPERDVPALIQRLTELIESPQRWAEIGLEGRRFVEQNYDSKKLSERLAALYNQAIAQFRARA